MEWKLSASGRHVRTFRLAAVCTDVFGKNQHGFQVQMRILANYYNRKGMRLHSEGNDTQAIRYYLKAIQSDGTWSVPYYNCGLVHKYRSEWVESYQCNAEAMRLNPTEQAAIWNMGIAATALSDWAEARRAWAAYGIKIPSGTGAIEEDFGVSPIRINAASEAEVVWARRIDPARAIITSIPIPTSGHRCGDLLLHDGAPVGTRISNGREVSVFNELAVLAQSTLATFTVTIKVKDIVDLVAFEDACNVAGCTAEDWSTIKALCKECSEGRPRHQNHSPVQAQIEGEHYFGIAAPSIREASAAVSSWLSSGELRSASEIGVT
jgi:hypothetical protein